MNLIRAVDSAPQLDDDELLVGKIEPQIERLEDQVILGEFAVLSILVKKALS